jgi:hypothetical protein
MLTYSVFGADVGKDSHYGAVDNFAEYYLPSIEQDRATERLGFLSLHNPLITYSVFRSKDRAVALDYGEVTLKDNSLLTEMVPNFYCLISGKFKSFGHLHAFRQKGSHHSTNPDSTGGGAPDNLDWMLTEKFRVSYHFYLDRAAPMLASKDGLDLATARREVRDQFKKSCAAHLLHPAFNVHRPPPPWFADYHELRQCLRSVYGEFDRTVLPRAAMEEQGAAPPSAERHPRLLLLTPRWNGGVPEQGSSCASWAAAESLIACPAVDARVLYVDQVWRDFAKSPDSYLAEIMQESPPDAVIVSSQFGCNPLKASTLAFLGHSEIPVVLLRDTPVVEPQHNNFGRVSHQVGISGERGGDPCPMQLWPPVPYQAFHDPKLPRDLGVFCLGEVLQAPGSLADFYLLAAAGVDLEGIRDWRYDWFIRKGKTLEQARTFRSRLFDQAYYLDNHPVALAADQDALTHYQQVGWRLNYNPNPLFDTAYYRSRHPDAELEGTNPLLHFLDTPVERCCDPHPYFNALYYLANNPELPAAGINPLDHYLQVGVAEGRRGCPPLEGHELAIQLKRSRLAVSFRRAACTPQSAVRGSLEAILCGCLLLEPEESPLSQWFIPMLDYVPYRDGEDLVEKTRHYLAHEDERRQISEVGSAKAARHFTGERFWCELYRGLAASPANIKQ